MHAGGLKRLATGPSTTEDYRRRSVFCLARWAETSERRQYSEALSKPDHQYEVDCVCVCVVSRSIAKVNPYRARKAGPAKAFIQDKQSPGPDRRRCG